MAHAFTDSDFASYMAAGANSHYRYLAEFEIFRAFENDADQRAAAWIHQAINHQPHQAEY